MELFLSVTNAALIAIFLQNLVLERALGANILLYAARKKENLIGLFIGIIYITTVSSIPIYFIDVNFSAFKYYNILSPLIYVLVVSVIYIISLVIVWRFFPRFFRYIKKYIHLAVFNCAVLGALFLQSVKGASLGAYIGYGLGTGLGFLLAATLLYLANERLNSDLVPAAFRGFPIMIIYVGVLSLALSAFLGYTGTV